MNVTFAAVSDAANLMVDSGKLNLLGVFNHMWAASMPVVTQNFSFAIMINFQKEETGIPHKIKIELLSPIKEVIFGVEIAEYVVQKPVVENAPAIGNVVLNLGNLEFKEFGEYKFEVHSDAALLHSHLFPVLQINNAQLPGGGVNEQHTKPEVGA